MMRSATHPRPAAPTIDPPVCIVRIATIHEESDGASYCDSLLRRERPLDLDENHGHVVVLIGTADERLDLAEDAFAQLARLEVAVLRHQAAKAAVAEQIALRRSSLR